MLPLFPILTTLLTATPVKTDIAVDRCLDDIRFDPKPPSIQESAVSGLLQRLLNEKASLFHVQVIPSSACQKDYFHVWKSENDTVVNVTGNRGTSVAWGIHYYLKEKCGCHVSWDGDQLNLPDPLPPANITLTALDKYRYYSNVCTSSYSMAWWGWERWEREIDWMALQGITLALAPVAQEAVWRNVYSSFGLTASDINHHFTGPAFLAWNRMGNIRGWLGPLSESWHNNSISLQRKILQRMTAFGIIPVTPAFSGIIPKAFARIYPGVEMTQFTSWNSFPQPYCCPYLLSPTEKLFNRVGRAYLNEYKKYFGLNHVYNCDTFNEMSPPSGNSSYLRAVGNSIYQSMADADPSAVWLLQSWMFHSDGLFWSKNRVKAFLTSVPLGKMLILDLQSELSPQYEIFESYFGQPFIWCMLHNFGGTLGLYGSSEKINQGPINARRMANSTMVGIGLTPEGINQNYVIYELMLENSWQDTPVQLSNWYKSYPTRRYGESNTFASNAWMKLKSTVYNSSTGVSQHNWYVIVRHPTLKLKPDVWYDVEEVLRAWDDMINAADSLNSHLFKHDLVDITRQAIQLIFDYNYMQLVQAFDQASLDDVNRYSRNLLQLLDDMDGLLASSPKFLLGNWLQESKSQATTEQERTLFEMNARNQITLWGPKGEIRDYACKQWAGLIKDYYTPRWRIFVSRLTDSVEKGTFFNQSEVSEYIYHEVELSFNHQNQTYPTIPSGDSISISKRIHETWRWL